MNQNSLTVLIPVSNEITDLQGTYESVKKALDVTGISDHEIVIVTQTSPSGKSDGAPSVATDIASSDFCVRHIDNPFFVGLGLQYRQGIHAATKDYIMMIPPHHRIEGSSLTGIMLYLGQAEAMFSYTANLEAQSPEVRYISKSYSTLCNVLFGLSIKNYNGVSIISRDLLKKVPMRSNNLVCLAEVVTYVIKSGKNFLELPQLIRPGSDNRNHGDEENISSIAGSLGSLFWRVSVENERLDTGQNIAVQPPLVLPAPDGPPDLKAIYHLASSNSIQTLHQIIVYLAKSLAKNFDHTHNSGVNQWNGWSPGFQDLFNIMRVVKALSPIVGTIVTKMAVNNIASSSKKIIRRKKKGNKKGGHESLTIIMPAYNEATNLDPAYKSATRSIRKAGIHDYEILIITNVSPDGSDDGTPSIATSISEEDPRVRHIHNDTYVGLGFKYRQGVKEATKEKSMMIPGDGEFEEDSITELISCINESEIVIPFTSNPEIRPPERQTVSRMFTFLCNMLFGLNIKYYNGLCIIPTRYLKAVPMSCDNFAYMAEILIYLLKSDVQYIEVPLRLKPVQGSKAFRPDSVNEVLETIATLFWKLNVEGFRVQIPEAK